MIDYYLDAHVEIRGLLSPYLSGTPKVFTPLHDRSTLVDVNTDLFPKDEFNIPVR